jgi:hypothetical protein
MAGAAPEPEAEAIKSKPTFKLPEGQRRIRLTD